jgi:hypothetical protein
MSNVCCLCAARPGRFCTLCGHHLCTFCSSHWAQRGQEAFKQLLGLPGNLNCDHPKGVRGGQDPEVV